MYNYTLLMDNQSGIVMIVTSDVTVIQFELLSTVSRFVS